MRKHLGLNKAATVIWTYYCNFLTAKIFVILSYSLRSPISSSNLYLIENVICHRILYRRSESRAQRLIIIFIEFFQLSRQFRARDKSLTRVMLQLCVSVSIETRARRVMYLTATHTLYLLIESWLFTAPDLFACTRKNESWDESSSFQQPSSWYFAVIPGCLFASTTAYSPQIIPRQRRTLHLRRVRHRASSILSCHSSLNTHEQRARLSNISFDRNVDGRSRT